MKTPEEALAAANFIPVILESPYAANSLADTALLLTYLRACVRDCLLRGEAPFASHGLYTQPGVLRDEVPIERLLGIRAGFVWRALAHQSVFYLDFGWSEGMKLGRIDAEASGRAIVERGLPPNWLEEQRARESAGASHSDWLVSFLYAA